MRAESTILHLDLDAFFAAVEQRDKPSLRGKPVVVGGVGARGVVATASYEARRYGVHSAMPTAEARRRCPHAAFLGGRFAAYHETSQAVMTVLRGLSPLVEPLSMDEAFVDLEAAGLDDHSVAAVSEVGRRLKEEVFAATGGLTASVGIGTSKLIAKIASDLDKPDGLVAVAPGLEADLLRPMDVTVIPGVGPATAERLRRIGVQTVAQLENTGVDELTHTLGVSHGTALFALARAEDDRPVVAEREAKSISVEDTFETDQVGDRLIEALVDRAAAKVSDRLRRAGMSGRTVTLKVRLYDFSTHTRSSTMSEPVDDPRTIARLARGLLGAVDTSGGVRLLGVGVSGLADWVQDDLFGFDGDGAGDDEAPAPEGADPERAGARRSHGWWPGMDVVHDDHGRGWVWGSGRGVVTVRFETAETPSGPVRSFAADDPALHAYTRPVAEGS